MKKIFALLLAFLLLPCLAACAKNTGFIEKETKETDIKWTDGIAFESLSPNTEQRNKNEMNLQ